MLETVGRDWLVEQVDDVRAISNIYSVDTKLSAKSPDLDTAIVAAGGDLKDGYASAIASPESQHIGYSMERQQRSMELLQRRAGGLGVTDIFAILRTHAPCDAAEQLWDPRSATTYGTCIHGGANIAGGQTTASFVAEISEEHALAWVTAAAAPCLSIFKPLTVAGVVPDSGPPPGMHYDAAARWWRHEGLHRLALERGLIDFLAAITPERDRLEGDFRASMLGALSNGNPADINGVISACWREADAAEIRWLALIGAERDPIARRYHAAWGEMNRIAGLDLAVVAADREKNPCD